MAWTKQDERWWKASSKLAKKKPKLFQKMLSNRTKKTKKEHIRDMERALKPKKRKKKKR